MRSHCPKCTARFWSVRYQSGGISNINNPEPVASGECLIVSCRNCGYQFTEPVAEAA